MTDKPFVPGDSHGPERIGPPGHHPFPPPKLDASGISRKWLNLAYGDVSPSQRLDLYLPEQGDGPFPLILAIHGGAFLGGDKDEMQIAPMLSGLRRGYAVASLNYRLSGEAIFPALVQDGKAAVRFLRAHAARYRLDPQRIAVWGGSAGGYLSAMLGVSAAVPELDDPADVNAALSCAVQAVVDWSGPTENFIKMDEEFLLSGRGTADHSAEGSPESLLMGAKITEIPDLVQKASPLSYANPDIPPFLIQHGELDHIVPVQQSIQFAAALVQAAGPERVMLEVLPEVYHHGDPAFETAENLEHVFAFLEQSLRAVKPPPFQGGNLIQTAAVETKRAERLLKALCNHFARKRTASYEGNRGQIDFGDALCTITASDEGLTFEAKADSEEGLAHVRRAVGEHLQRFNPEEELVISWKDASTN